MLSSFRVGTIVDYREWICDATGAMGASGHAGVVDPRNPVPLIYLDETRSFGGALDNSGVRMAHYNEVIDRSIEVLRQRGFVLPTGRTSYCREC